MGFDSLPAPVGAGRAMFKQKGYPMTNRTREIPERLIYENRTWVNQLTSREKECLCLAGLMTLTQQKTWYGKSMFHNKPMYYWTEAGRQALGDVRADLLKQEDAA